MQLAAAIPLPPGPLPRNSRPPSALPPGNSDAPRPGPRERALAEGVCMLGDAELLALVLGTGSPGRPVSIVSAAVIERFGGLHGIARSGAHAIAEHTGVGHAKALRLLAGMELGRRAAIRPPSYGGTVGSSFEVAQLLAPRIAGLAHEEMWLLALDGRNHVRCLRRVAQGGLHASAVRPQDILRLALADAASAIVLVHNHPSGNPEPSPEDLEMTERLEAAAATVGLPLVDHVVVGHGGRYTSLLDLGVIGGATGSRPT